MITGKLLLASVLAALGCVGDGCILTAATTALTFRWTAIRAGLTLGFAHLIYESIGLWLTLFSVHRNENFGLFLSLIGSFALLICIRRHSVHIHHYHPHGEECHHEDYKAKTGPVAALSIIAISSSDAFLAGVSLPAGFQNIPTSSLFISASITATLVGLMTAVFLLLAMKKESRLSLEKRRTFRNVTLFASYCFVIWLAGSSLWHLARG
jgi:hypothetical protein